MKQVQSPRISGTLQYIQKTSVKLFPVHNHLYSWIYHIFSSPPKPNPHPPRKKIGEQKQHITRKFTSVWLGINWFHAEVLRYGSHQGDAWGQLLKWWGNFPNKPMGKTLLPKWSTFGVVRLGGNPPISGNTQRCKLDSESWSQFVWFNHDKQNNIEANVICLMVSLDMQEASFVVI